MPNMTTMPIVPLGPFPLDACQHGFVVDGMPGAMMRRGACQQCRANWAWNEAGGYWICGGTRCRNGAHAGDCPAGMARKASSWEPEGAGNEVRACRAIEDAIGDLDPAAIVKP